MPTIQNQTYLAECLQNARDFQRSKKDFERWKKDYPEEYRRQQSGIVTELHERIQNAFMELLNDPDFRLYIEKHTGQLKSSKVLPIEKIDPIVGHLVSTRWVLVIVRSPLNMLEIEIGFLDDHGNFHKDNFVTDEAFMRTLRCCDEPKGLVAEIVSCFGEE